jgi:5-methylcytosine-specific restriction protein A
VLFGPDRELRRRLIHARYGGQDQGGISTPAEAPFVFVFTGEGGEQYGYRDHWEAEGIFRYYGEGQVGDMVFQRGNRAVRDHAINGKELHLFKRTRKSFVEYVGQMVCAGYELEPGVPDRDNTARTAIVFRLVPAETLGQTTGDYLTPLHPELDDDDLGLDGLSTAALRVVAMTTPPEGLSPSQLLQAAYRRSAAVKQYVLTRAAGICEGCR